MCRPDGGVIDDQILYRLGPAEFMMVVNAGTREGDSEWIRQHIGAETEFTDESDNTAKIDIQGPRSIAAANALFDTPLPPLDYYQFCAIPFGGRKLLVSRTGYTGEIGIEIYCPNELAVPIWRRSVELAAVPAGLGARDTLRLEMGYPLYGHELSTQRNAGATGYSWAISGSKAFIGSEAVHSSVAQESKLVGLLLEGRRTAREGDSVCDASGTVVGAVTSGSFSPSLRQGIALGYVEADCAEPGTRLTIETRRDQLNATVVKTPFYKNGTARKPFGDFIRPARTPDS
jgi:aminomethyltransferase